MPILANLYAFLMVIAKGKILCYIRNYSFTLFYLLCAFSPFQPHKLTARKVKRPMEGQKVFKAGNNSYDFTYSRYYSTTIKKV